MTTTLDAALETMRQTRQELLDVVHALGENDLDRKGVVGDWSIKNVLAHLAAWEEWVAGVLPERIRTGETPADFRERADNEDRFNALEVDEREELTPHEQVMELERIRAELLRYVGGLDAATLERRNLWQGWEGTLPEYLLAALHEHEAEHLEPVRHAAEGLTR